MSKQILLVPVLGVLMMVPPAWAEAGDDNLLSILDGGETEVGEEFQERSELTLALRKKLGSPTAEQNIFLNFLDKSEFEKASYQWDSAFSGSAFSRSANGQALYAYLMFKNQLEANGVEALFRVERPDSIMNEMVKLWRQVAPHTHVVWQVSSVKWAPAWTHFFDVSTEVQVKSRKIYSLDDTKRLLESLTRTKLKSAERAKLQWQMVLSLAINDDIVRAAKVLAHLMKDQNDVISKDLMNITAARLLYQQGYLTPAIRYYQKVPKSSEYWFVAQEEMAWSYIRKGEPQNTMATTTTLTNPAFAAQVGPESVFLQALSQLKVCDYPGVAKSIESYRKRFRPKVEQLTSLVRSPKNPQTERLLRLMQKGRVELLKLGADAQKLPRYVSRDEVLRSLATVVSYAHKETKTAEAIYQRSLSGGTSQVGFQESFAQLKMAIEQRWQSARSAYFNRIKDLGEQELSEIHRVLQKMHIVEAELIQQISQAEKVIRASTGKVDKKKGTTGSSAKHNVKYPLQKEVWFDELSNYKVDIKKGCQAVAQAVKK